MLVIINFVFLYHYCIIHINYYSLLFVDLFELAINIFGCCSCLNVNRLPFTTMPRNERMLRWLNDDIISASCKKSSLASFEEPAFNTLTATTRSSLSSSPPPSEWSPLSWPVVVFRLSVVIADGCIVECDYRFCRTFIDFAEATLADFLKQMNPVWLNEEKSFELGCDIVFC